MPDRKPVVRLPGHLVGFTMQVLEWAGSGVVGTYAVQLSSHLYRAVFRDGGSSMTSGQAHDVARRAINRAYPGVVDEEQEPVRESLGGLKCMVTFGVEDKEYWARWTRSWGRPAQMTVGFDSIVDPLLDSSP